MTNNDNFFQQAQPAAVLKHALLGEYARVFASAVGSRNPSQPIWVIDGYAGAGAYEEADPDGRLQAGSPLVLLRVAAGMKKDRDVRTIFIEAKPALADSLSAYVAPFQSHGQHVTVLRGTVEERMTDAWRLVGNGPVVTFLDPFGVAMNRATMTDVLLSRRAASSEVIVNINLEAVWRIGGNLEERDGEILARSGQESGVQRVDAFFGGTWWRNDFHAARQAQGSAARAADAVVSEYRRSIREATGFDSLSIPIRRRPFNEPLFLMTLFFKHPMGGYKFADAAGRATKKWRDTYRRQELKDHMDAQPMDSLFSDDELHATVDAEAEQQERQLDEEWVSAICENVRALNRGSLPVGENVSRILGRTLGLAGERHIRKAWDRLAAEGYLLSRDKSLKRLHLAVMVRA